MIRFILLIAIGVAGWLIYKLYLRQLLSQGRQGKIKLLLIGLGFVLVLLALSGRSHILFGLIGAVMTQASRLAPLLLKFLPFIRQFQGGSRTQSQQPNQQSQVRSERLVMTLDHDTGDIDGEVINGAFAGRKLRALSQNELMQLLQECQQHDPEGVRLLDAFVSRVHGPEFWSGAGPKPDRERAESTSGKPSVAEASEILGLEANASREQVVSAHRKLMGRVHPDKGGSNYLASKINAAKAVLLEQTESGQT